MGSADTRFSFSTGAWTDQQADGLIVPVFKKKAADGKSAGKGKDDKKTNPADSLVWTDAHKALDKALRGMILATASEEKFDGGLGKTLVFRKTPGDKIKARRVVVLGLGEAEALRPHALESRVQKALGTVLGLTDLSTVAMVLPEGNDKLGRAVLIETVVDAVYQSTYRSAEAKDKKQGLKNLVLVSAQAASNADKAALSLGEVLAKGRSRTKDLVNMPSNLKTTDTLVNRAKEVGKLAGIKTTVQANKKWLAANMPCFFTVARGSLDSDPPKFITLQYKPTNGKAKKKIAIIGKSVIFDTGGYQVKPGNSMNTMKGDMTGGAVVVNVMEALAALKPQNIEVTAYLAATPNKIDSGAMIPDSIVDTTCGKKVEIRHTDAEGRLTLIDAVAMAAKEKPDEILTIATLTGSASVAVGRTIALMGNGEDIVTRVYEAGRSLGEPIQALEVTEEDYDNIKSKLDAADIINTSHKRERGAQSAAAFVMSGAPDGMPMAHMDIAGADMTGDEKATGIGFKTMLQYLLNENGNLPAANGKASATAPRKAAKSTAKPAARASGKSASTATVKKASAKATSGKKATAKKQ